MQEGQPKQPGSEPLSASGTQAATPRNNHRVLNDKEAAHPPPFRLVQLFIRQSQAFFSIIYGAPKRQRALNTCPPRVPQYTLLPALTHRCHILPSLRLSH